jgi:hypothetical protein
MFSLPLRLAHGADGIGAEGKLGRARRGLLRSAPPGLLVGADCSFVRRPDDVSNRKSIAWFDRLFAGLRLYRKGGRHL